MSLPRYGLAIPACNGVSRHWVLPIKVEVASGMQSNGTGPTSRQLQDKVGGVTPAGLFPDRPARWIFRYCATRDAIQLFYGISAIPSSAGAL